MAKLNKRLKHSIAEKLKLEAGMPTNWLDGRGGQQRNTFANTTPREDDEGTNFTIKHSGQRDMGDRDDIEERIKTSIRTKLRKESGLPSYYKSKHNPVSDQHTILGSTEREKDNDKANFTVKNSGQSDLDEDLHMYINDLRDLIPAREYKNRELKLDILKALNAIYKKHNIAITIKIR